MTPTKGEIAEFRFVSWSAPEVAWTIEYPLEVMNEIRAYACNELLRLSHGGAEVGGVLYGSRQADSIRILTWRPIACEYADGEALRLSHSDRMNLAVQLEAARRSPDLRDLRPVGWFVSHPRGGVAMNESDLEIHSGFFPESSHVTLVIHPTGAGRAEAGFFAREADGSVRSGSSYKNFMLEPINATADAARDVEPAGQETEVAAPVELAASAPVSDVPVASPAVPSFASPGFGRPSTSPHTVAPPVFQTDEPLPARERWLWAIPIALALGLGAWLLYSSILGPGRNKPAETSSMAFRISSNAARTAQLQWDANSRAVRDSDHGEIDITDDGKTSHVVLSRDQLHSGRMAYLRQSGDVGFQLTVYPASGAPVHESTRLIAPASSAPTEPPQLLGRDPQAPTLPVAERDALQKQVRQLTEALRNERARTDQLQNLNRILENRLGIQPEAPKP
jgi:hypothetical protein